MAAERMVGRVGAAAALAAGGSMGVARTLDDYHQIAVALASKVSSSLPHLCRRPAFAALLSLPARRDGPLRESLVQDYWRWLILSANCFLRGSGRSGQRRASSCARTVWQQLAWSTADAREEARGKGGVRRRRGEKEKRKAAGSRHAFLIQNKCLRISRESGSSSGDRTLVEGDTERLPRTANGAPHGI
jgi:hypothetical protein